MSRWHPKPEQIQILEAIFNSGGKKIPPREEIKRIRSEVERFGQVRDVNVFYWFQNRKSRIKAKRASSTSSTSTSTSVQSKPKPVTIPPPSSSTVLDSSFDGHHYGQQVNSEMGHTQSSNMQAIGVGGITGSRGILMNEGK